MTSGNHLSVLRVFNARTISKRSLVMSLLLLLISTAQVAQAGVSIVFDYCF